MEDSDYNRKIAEQVKMINNKYIRDAERKGQLLKDMPITRNTIQGSGFWSDFADGFKQGFVMPFQAVNKLVGGEKKRRGRPRKGGIGTGGIGTGGGLFDDINKFVRGGVSTGGVATGGGFFDDIASTVQSAVKLAPLLALGKEKKQRGRPRKGGAIALNKREENFSTPVRAGRRHRGGIGTGGIGTGGKLGLSRKLLKARAVGSGMAELEGAGFFDDVLEGISNTAKVVTKGVDLADKLGLLKKGKGKKVKRGGLVTGGVSTGGKKGASKWISHVKAYAKKHNIKYNEALKDPKCKASYRK